MSQQPSGPPPPYPGAGDAYSSPNPTYPPPFDPSKGNAFPQAAPYPQYYHWPSGYSNPNQPGAGYSTPAGYGTPQQYGAPGYGQPSQAHATTVVVTQPPLTVIQTFRDVPVRTHCPHCRAEILTAVYYETGTFAWVLCCILILVGCGAGCCLIPFCVDGCKDVIHTCPNCQQQIARYSRM